MTTKTMENDLSRPVWERAAGQLGLYLDMYDAQATLSSDVGSKLLFLSSLTEKMYDEVTVHSVHQLRALFYQHSVVNNCTIETVKKGVAIVLRPYDKAAIDALWTSLADGTLQKAVDAIWSNDAALLAKLSVVRMHVRVRLYDDEKKFCIDELQQVKVKQEWKRTAGNMVAPILKEIRNFHSNQLSDVIMKLKDDESIFNQPRYLGEFVSVLMDTSNRSKPSPGSTEPTSSGIAPALGGGAAGAAGPKCCSLADYYPLSQQSLLTKDSRNHSLQYFNNFVQRIPSIMHDIQQKMIIPLLQIHPWHDEQDEAPKQPERRRHLLQLYEQLLQFTDENMNLNTPTFAHRLYAQRLLPREREQFLSLVSIVPVFIQLTEEFEEKVDEYLIDAE